MMSFIVFWGVPGLDSFPQHINPRPEAPEEKKLGSTGSQAQTPRSKRSLNQLPYPRSYSNIMFIYSNWYIWSHPDKSFTLNIWIVLANIRGSPALQFWVTCLFQSRCNGCTKCPPRARVDSSQKRSVVTPAALAIFVRIRNVSTWIRLYRLLLCLLNKEKRPSLFRMAFSFLLFVFGSSF